jgi:hypothetical protein
MELNTVVLKPVIRVLKGFVFQNGNMSFLSNGVPYYVLILVATYIYILVEKGEEAASPFTPLMTFSV